MGISSSSEVEKKSTENKTNDHKSHKNNETNTRLAYLETIVYEKLEQLAKYYDCFVKPNSLMNFLETKTLRKYLLKEWECTKFQCLVL